MFDLFKIGFLTVTFADVIDIIIVTFIIYKLFTVLRGTIAAQIFIGLIIVLLLSIAAQALTLKALSFLLQLVTDIWVIAFIILFQPEIRRLLVLLGRNPLVRIFFKSDAKDLADILTDTAFELAQFQHGALIVVVKTSGLKGVVETGELINARVTKNLLRSIFFPRSPLHDGAVVIRNDVVEAARCTLPLSAHTAVDGDTLGMRHRAGIGITEQADVISLIVSEETGGISVAENGELKKGLSKEALRKLLAESMKTTREKGLKGIFEQFGKQK
jgi:diadenylate cyclase